MSGQLSQIGAPKQDLSRLDSAAEKRAKEIIALYPESKSAVMPLLYLAQEQLGWLSDGAMEWVAKQLGITPAHVKSVATFYTMYYKHPVGKYHVQVCRTLSCMLCGTMQILEHLKGRFGVSAHQVTADGMWSFEPVECLGSCGSAPMVQINDVFFEHLTIEKLDGILDRIAREQPDLRYSTMRGELGEGMKDCPRSEVWVRGETVRGG